MKLLRDVDCSTKYLYAEVQYPACPLLFFLSHSVAVAASDGTCHAACIDPDDPF